jgi:chromosome segregation ATPase
VVCRQLDTVTASVESNVSKAAFAAAELSLCQRSLEEVKAQSSSQLATAHSRIAALETQLAEKDSNLQSWMHQSRQDAECAKSELQSLVLKHQREIEEFTAKYASDMAAVQARLSESQEGFDAVSNKLEKSEREFSAELEALREQLGASQAYSQSLEGYLTTAKTASTTTIEELTGKVRELQAVVVAREQQVASLQSEVQVLQQDLQTAGAEFNKSRETCEGLKAQLASSEASVRQLEAKCVDLQANLQIAVSMCCRSIGIDVCRGHVFHRVCLLLQTNDKNRLHEECGELKLRLQASVTELESCKAALQKVQQQSDALIADRDARMSAQVSSFVLVYDLFVSYSW